MIEAEHPQRMEIGRSDSIRVSLVRISGTGQTYVPTIEIPGHTIMVASPIPVGTAGVPVEYAFGTEYDVFAVAYLAASSFEVKAVTADEQALDQERVNWEWNITPKSEGPQAINISIEARWRPRRAGILVERQIWRVRYEIPVEKPWITTGEISILTLLSGLIGSALSIPWIYERIKEKPRKKSASKSTKRSPSTSG